MEKIQQKVNQRYLVSLDTEIEYKFPDIKPLSDLAVIKDSPEVARRVELETKRKEGFKARLEQRPKRKELAELRQRFNNADNAENSNSESAQ